MNGHLETVRITGLGQQGLGAFWIIGLGLQVRVLAEHAFDRRLTGRLCLLFHHAFDDRFAVDRLGKRLADFPLVQRIMVEIRAVVLLDERRPVALAVDVEIDHPVRQATDNLDLRFLGQPRDVGRRNLVDDVHVAVEQGGNPGRTGFDDLVGDLVPMRLGAPVVGIALKHDPVARNPFDKLVGSGADHALAGVVIFGLVAFAMLLRNDWGRRQVVGQQRIRALGHDMDRVVVDLLVFLVQHVACGGRRAFQFARFTALHVEQDVIGGKRRSVRELHALAQLDFPGVLVDRLP